MLGALLFAVAAVGAITRCGAGLLLIVYITQEILLCQFAESVNIVVGVSLEDLGDVDALGAGVAVTAAGAVQLGLCLQ